MAHLLTLTAVAAMAAGASAQCTPLGEAANAAGLSSLVETVTAVGAQPGAAPIIAAVAATEPVDEPITIFAPNNEAFEMISEVVSGLSEEEVVAVLANHVVPTELSAEDITDAIAASDPNPAEVETLLGPTLEATLDGENVMVSPTGTEITAQVVEADIETCAGVVHIVDMVLVPSEDAPLDIADAPMAEGPAGAVVPGVYTQYEGKDYIPESAASGGVPNAVPVEDIGIPQGILVDDAAGCEAECDMLPGCNAASFYTELIADTGTNCFLKTIGEACMLPADAKDDPTAILLLKCEDDQAVAPVAGAPLAADAPGAAAGAEGPDGAIDEVGDRGIEDLDTTGDDAVAPSDDGSAALPVAATVAAVAVAAVAALL